MSGGVRLGLPSLQALDASTPLRIWLCMVARTCLAGLIQFSCAHHTLCPLCTVGSFARGSGPTVMHGPTLLAFPSCPPKSWPTTEIKLQFQASAPVLSALTLKSLLSSNHFWALANIRIWPFLGL
jgi:hypothetical protein